MRTLVPGVLLALALTSSASAETRKKRVAILTLEHDKNAATVALDVSTEMRNRVKAGKLRFDLAPNTDVSQAKAKADGKCEDEATQCMAKIGANLGADMLVFGRVEADGNGGYRLAVKLLDVNKKKLALAATEKLASADAGVVRATARRLVEKLAGK